MESWTLLPKGMLVTFQLSTNSASPWESLVLLWWFALWVIKGWIVNALWWSICSTLTLFDLNVAPYSLHLLDRFRTFDLLFVFNFNFSPFLLYSTVFWNIYGYKIMYLELNKDIFDWESIFQTPVTPFPLSSNFFHWKNNLFKRFLNFAYILTSSYCWFPPLYKL